MAGRLSGWLGRCVSGVCIVEGIWLFLSGLLGRHVIGREALARVDVEHAAATVVYRCTRRLPDGTELQRVRWASWSRLSTTMACHYFARQHGA